jgi:death-on-curing protein
MRHLSIAEILDLHERLLADSGGASGVRDLGAIESAVAQPHAAFGGQDLYPDLVAKAAALCFSLVMNHPFIDGNKRIGHAAMETFLLLNGHEIDCDVDEQERVILQLAAGDLSRNAFSEWVRLHTTTESSAISG